MADDRRTVVGVDGSQTSRLALQWAMRQAELTGATVDAILAWQMPPTYGMPPVAVSAAEDADLLVVGNRGHGGFVGALLGSVSQHSVHLATCPVVVIRSPRQ